MRVEPKEGLWEAVGGGVLWLEGWTGAPDRTCGLRRWLPARACLLVIA
ncbi:hypothetical protein [Nonomuraea sp. SYSU D8015]|nr:hypothetical protein [Nonomuraea sp. SYSU D8015]